MSMACNSLQSPNLSPFSSAALSGRIPLGRRPGLVPASLVRRRSVDPLSAVAWDSGPVDLDYLEGEFGGHGVTFKGIGESCVATMELQSGATATIMLPSGLVTSYKAPMWHGERLELLHTLVTADEGGDALISGGMSMLISCKGDDNGGGVSWSPDTWLLQNVAGSPEDCVQIEMTACDPEGMVEVRHVLILQEDALSSELIVSNPNSSMLRVTGALITHFTVSTPDATYAIGLEGSDFFSRPPVDSGFCIIPPENAQERTGNLWGLVPGWGNGAQSSDVGNDNEEGEEDENYKHLTEQMSRIYSSAPRIFTMMDRGRRNSISVERHGFEELYVFSPGSGYDFYSRYAYICIGQSAMRKPLILGPKHVWKGGQRLHNPNL